LNNRLSLAVLAVLLWLPSTASAQDEPFLDCRKAFLLSTEQPSRPETTPAGKIKTVLPGKVDIVCDDVRVFADRVEWSPDEDWIELTGNVVVKQGGLSIYAARARLNRRTRLGTFYEARGSSVISQDRIDKTLFGGAEPDVRFSAKSIEKTGPTTYKLIDGSFTSCAQPTPRWNMAASSMTIEVDDHVTLSSMVFRVKDVPVFYLPKFYYPINKEDRSTGMLMPSIGTSTFGGFTISNAFFWAISRSQDLTLHHDLFKKTGQGLGAHYRFVTAPGSSGSAAITMIDERERAATDTLTSQPGRRSYDVKADVSQGLPRNFRAVGTVTYFTNATTQHLYEQNVYEASQRNRKIAGDVSGSVGKFRLSAGYDQNDIFNSFSSTSRRGYGPRVNLDFNDSPVGRSKIYVGMPVGFAYVLRVDDLDDPLTDHSLWRIDARPRIRAPLSSLTYLNATASADWRLTEWSESVDTATGEQVAVPVTRQLLKFDLSMSGPKFSRVFNAQGERAFKHLIEPSLSYNWTSAYRDFDRLVQLDGVEGEVGGNTTITYGLSTTVQLRTRPKAPAGTPATGPPPASYPREVFRASIQQSYYTNALRASFDPQYNAIQGFTAPSPYSDILVQASTTPVSSVSADFRTNIDPRFRKPKSYGANARISSKIAQVTVGWSKQQVIPGLPGFEDEKFAPHFLNTSTTLRRANGRVGGTFGLNYDFQHGTLLNQRIVAFYNSQCCGITIDYQKNDLSYLGLPDLTTNHKFGFSFSLAGIGSFANPFGSFGG
jgi:lipopolysaccharide assembly outer membrane protein LptD (OstA)